jgi:hypothetical protein
VGLQTEKRNSYADFKIKKRQALWNVIGSSVVAITVGFMPGSVLADNAPYDNSKEPHESPHTAEPLTGGSGEKGWEKLMKSIGGEVFLDYRPSRPLVLQKDKPPYQIVLGPEAK